MKGIDIKTLQSVKNGTKIRKELVFDPISKKLVEQTVGPNSIEEGSNKRVLKATADDFKMF